MRFYQLYQSLLACHVVTIDHTIQTRCTFPESRKSHDKFRDLIATAISTLINRLSRQSLKSPYSSIRYSQQQDSHWEASSRQRCYAAGQYSAECASDKDSLLRIVLLKLSPQDFSACKFPHVCKTGSMAYSVTL